ncbi:hypothetical protein [Streptomyces sp. NPDC102490]|jgi:hypothetical protein|uniref:hypothetical protein n=1 Tax=Streptomyces sp. NPDC102490 TaxID=3366183 RepID=UPI00382ABC1C
MGRDAVTGGGCAVSLAGAVGAVVVWWQTARTQRHLGKEFENNGQDFGAVLTELPLVFLAGAVVPAVLWGLGAWLLGRRRRRSASSGASDLHA